MRHVDLREILGFVGAALHLARNADDLAFNDLGLRELIDRNAGADRISARQVPAHERFIDDAHGGAGRGVAVGKGATGNDREIQCREVRGTDDLIVRARAVDVSNGWLAYDLE